MKIIIVGGIWDNKGGKKSTLVDKMGTALCKAGYKLPRHDVTVYNGSSYNSLRFSVTHHIEIAKPDILVWMPNVPNDLPKIPNIKSLAPKTMLITSKRNDNNKYSFQDIIAHGLGYKSNLMIEIQSLNQRYVGRLLDPLGNQWFPNECGFTADFEALILKTIERAIELSKITRKASIRSPEDFVTLKLGEDSRVDTFCNIARLYAEEFHKLLKPAKNATRFMGNASFRCARGFPSIRLGDNSIFVSKRNVDKRAITPNAFVQVGMNRYGDFWYRGPHKPSVDAPVQVNLYQIYRSSNFMMHSHAYIEGAPFTKKMVPCGGMQELSEIHAICQPLSGGARLVDPPIKTYPIAINLKGHGSLVMMIKPEDIHQFKYIARPMPEIQHTD